MIVDISDTDAVKLVSTRHGFSDPAILEKFIMNFRVHEILSQTIPCYLHGGLSTPFYTSNPLAKRLSVDLDLFVRSTYEEMATTVPNILAHHALKCEQRGPKTAKKLLQFNVKYPTARRLTAGLGNMKVDIVCEVDMPIPSKTFPRGHELFIGKTTHDIVAVTHGFLIADKISALATNTIGYPAASKFPKQIHDVGHLLTSASMADIKEAITTFETVTSFKSERHAKTPSTKDIISDVVRLMSELLILDNTVSLQEEYMAHFEHFKTTYLSKKLSYDDDYLKSNILKTWIYALCVKESMESHIDADVAAQLVYEGIHAHENYTDGEASVDVANTIKDLSGWFPETRFPGDSPQNLHLLHRIHKIMRQ